MGWGAGAGWIGGGLALPPTTLSAGQVPHWLPSLWRAHSGHRADHPRDPRVLGSAPERCGTPKALAPSVGRVSRTYQDWFLAWRRG